MKGIKKERNIFWCFLLDSIEAHIAKMHNWWNKLFAFLPFNHYVDVSVQELIKEVVTHKLNKFEKANYDFIERNQTRKRVVLLDPINLFKL